MARKITFTSALPDDIDERVEKIQARLEELKPELEAMAEELEKIGWDLRNSKGFMAKF
jgi:prefoldin subunit 5